MTSSGFPLHSDQNPSRSQVAGWRCSPVSPESPCVAYSSSIVIISVYSMPPLSWLSFPPQNISYVITLQMRPNILPIPPLLPPHQEHFSSFLKDTKPFPAWRPSSILPNLSWMSLISHSDHSLTLLPQKLVFGFSQTKCCPLLHSSL